MKIITPRFSVDTTKYESFTYGDSSVSTWKRAISRLYKRNIGKMSGNSPPPASRPRTSDRWTTRSQTWGCLVVLYYTCVSSVSQHFSAFCTTPYTCAISISRHFLAFCGCFGSKMISFDAYERSRAHICVHIYLHTHCAMLCGFWFTIALSIRLPMLSLPTPPLSHTYTHTSPYNVVRMPN